jgi:hypothetical protein
MLMLMLMLEHFICELFVPILPVLLRISVYLIDHK